MKPAVILIAFIFLSLIKLTAQEETHLCAEAKILSRTLSPSLHKVNYKGDERIDITYYKLILDVSYENRFLIGEVTVNAEVIDESLNNIFLDLSNNLSVDSILMDNLHLQFNHFSDKINISLPDVYQIHNKISVTIYYRGSPVASGFGSFMFGNNIQSAWSLSQPYGAIDWWPCKNTPNDKADSSDVWVRTSNNLQVVSNGNLIEIFDHRDGTHTYKWKNTYPISHYLISVTLAEFYIYEDYFQYSDTDSMLVVHYVYPTGFDLIKSQLDKTIDMLEFFTKIFGEYPFIREKYGHAQFGWGGGMEHQTISSMGSWGDRIMAHELAHQWFGNKVTCKDWHNIWINEGFASYSEALYQEYKGGNIFYDNVMFVFMDHAKNAQGSVYVSDISNPSNIFNYQRSYAKGAVVLHMLRGITGDSLFFKILQKFHNDPILAYSNANTNDFLRVVEEVTGESFYYFFQQWIYGENYPKYIVRWKSNTISENQYTVEINVEQLQNSFPSFYKMPVNITIYTEDGKQSFNIFNDEQSQIFNFTTSSKPKYIQFDEENWILKDVLIIDDDKFSPYEYSLEQNFPNPFNSGTTILFNIAKNEFVTIKIYDLLGSEVATLLNEDLLPGSHVLQITPLLYPELNKLSSGIYFYRIITDNFSEAKKMVILR